MSEAVRLPVSVVILTLNEECNIRDCLASVWASDDVHVLDSDSSDRTVEIARECGAKVWSNSFTSFGSQRNWAIDNIPTRYEWQLQLDADERLTAPLIAEIVSVLATNPSEAGFYLANRMILNGTWLRRSSGYPVYQMRLFHKGRMRFQDHGHGQREVASGPIGTLREPYDHFNFSHGIDEWFARHDRYSTSEAQSAVAELSQTADWMGLISFDSIRRRRAQKACAWRLPCRPLIRTVEMLFLRGGFLDGRAGWKYASMVGAYERMTDQKIAALRSKRLPCDRA